MIIIQARIPVLVKQRQQAQERIRRFVHATRKESGCLGCEAMVSIDEPATVVICQYWQDEDDLRAHANGDNLTGFLADLPEFLAGEVNTVRYGVERRDEMQASIEVVEEADSRPDGVTLH